MSDQNSENSKEERQESVERQMEGAEPGTAGQTASPAPEFEQGTGEAVVDDGEEHPSVTGQGNVGEEEPGRETTGTQGADRPVGESTPRDQSGIDQG